MNWTWPIAPIKWYYQNTSVIDPVEIGTIAGASVGLFVGIVWSMLTYHKTQDEKHLVFVPIVGTVIGTVAGMLWPFVLSLLCFGVPLIVFYIALFFWTRRLVKGPKSKLLPKSDPYFEAAMHEIERELQNPSEEFSRKSASTNKYGASKRRLTTEEFIARGRARFDGKYTYEKTECRSNHHDTLNRRCKRRGSRGNPFP